jgi:hypothetical protein
MIAKSIQFNRRNALSLLLAVLMLTLATTPALAWFDEGGNGQASQPCRLISDGQAAPTVYCHQVTPHYGRPVAEQPVVRPSIARAEQGPFFDQFATELLVQSTAK